MLQQRLLKEELDFAECYSIAKSSYEMRLVADSQSHLSRVFRYLRQMTKSEKIPLLMSFNCQCASDTSGKANLFNKIFYSVLTRSSLCSSNQTFTSTNHDHISSISSEEDEVFHILSTLNGSKTVAIDGNSPPLVDNSKQVTGVKIGEHR